MPVTMDDFRQFFVCGIFLVTLVGPGYVVAKKEAQTLDERVHALAEISSEQTIIRLNGDRFHQFIKATPRNYSFIVMLTALQTHRKCVICRNAYDEFRHVANSGKYFEILNNTLFFGMVDFDEGPDVFTSLGLNSAPIFMHFPKKGKPKRGDTMDIQRLGFQAETIAKWIAERTNIQIRVFRPYNYSGTVFFVSLFGLIGAVVYKTQNNFDFLYSKTIWGIAALSLVFVMTSGQMWNHIRGPPFMSHSPRGTVGYIHGSSGGQFIVETYIVIVLSAAVTLGMILMQQAASSRNNSKKRKTVAVIGLTLVVVFFSLMISIFRMKAQGYPYSFLFK